MSIRPLTATPVLNKAIQALCGFEVGDKRIKSYGLTLSAIDAGQIMARLNEAGFDIVQREWWNQLSSGRPRKARRQRS